MCFTVHPDYPNKLIVEEDILVYKGLDKKDSGEFCSPWFGMIVVFYTLLTSVLDSPRYKIDIANKPHLIINRGLHSTKVKLQYMWSSHTFKAIIPKGSEYYFNPSTGDYVSNQLIVTNKQI